MADVSKRQDNQVPFLKKSPTLSRGVLAQLGQRVPLSPGSQWSTEHQKLLKPHDRLQRTTINSN